MEKETLDFKRGLSIQELEDRHELTIAVKRIVWIKMNTLNVGK